MSESLIPESWISTKFTEVLDVQGGTQPPKSEFLYEPAEGYIRLLQIRDFGERPVPTYIPNSSKLKKCEFNDVLVGRYGASLGRICTGMSGAYNVALAKIIKPESIDLKFVKHFLNSEHFQFALQLLSRSAQNGFNKEDLATFDFFVPPLAEQQQIAQKLDELLAQVDTLKTRLDAIPNILKRFRQSVLAAAVSGRLTEEWRAENKFSADACLESIKLARFKLWRETELEKYAEKNAVPPKDFEKKYEFPESVGETTDLPSSWHGLSWNQISMWITYGFTRPMPHVEGGPLIVTAKNVRDGEIDLNNVHHTTFSAFNELRPKDKPREGDLLIVKDGATTGRACIAPKNTDDYCISQSVAVVWLKYSPMERKFLLWTVQSDRTQKRIQEVMAGMAMPHLSITDFGKMVVGVPPLEEQTEIVRRVEQLFAYADQIEQRVKDAQARVNHLTQSILAKAFRGELTAEWRAQNPELISGENSAAALLERIRVEREVLGKTKRKVKA